MTLLLSTYIHNLINFKVLWLIFEDIKRKNKSLKVTKEAVNKSLVCHKLSKNPTC